MSQADHYEPCFSLVPEKATERWTLLRKFLSRWYGLSLPITRDLKRVSRDQEQRLGRRLPASIREWIALAEDLRQSGSFERVFRDIFEIEDKKEFGHTTLLCQCEGDIYWCVANDDFEKPDPPVVTLRHVFETGNWAEGWRDAPSLTCFVLTHLAHFLGLGYVRTRDIDQTVIAQLEKTFPVSADWDGLRVFEMTDLIAFVRQRSEYHTLIVARKNSLQPEEMPEILQQLSP